MSQYSNTRLSPTDLHETLDRRGLIAGAQGPGVYALQIETPDTVEGVARAWRETVDAPLPGNDAKVLTVSRVAYVGASQHVANRLAEHARGDVRQATFVDAFELVGLLDVWSHPEPAQTAERARGRELRSDGWAVWTDGVLL